MLRSILHSEFSTFSTEVVLLIRGNSVFERGVMEKSGYSQWGRGLPGWTKSLDSNCASSWIFIYAKKNRFSRRKRTRSSSQVFQSSSLMLSDHEWGRTSKPVSTGVCWCCPGCEGQPLGVCVTQQSCRSGTDRLRWVPRGTKSSPGSGGSPRAAPGEGFSSHGSAVDAKERKLPWAVSLVRLLPGDIDRVTESLGKDPWGHRFQSLTQ